MFIALGLQPPTCSHFAFIYIVLMADSNLKMAALDLIFPTFSLKPEHCTYCPVSMESLMLWEQAV